MVMYSDPFKSLDGSNLKILVERFNTCCSIHYCLISDLGYLFSVPLQAEKFELFKNRILKLSTCVDHIQSKK
eukprot:c43272_g1_i1 orf=208-423(-)